MLFFAISGRNPDSLIRNLRSLASLADDSKKLLQLGPGSLICSHIAERFGESDGRAAIAHAELAIDIAGMHLDRSGCEHQLTRNLLIREVLVE